MIPREQPPIPLDMGGVLHEYALRGGEARAEKAREVGNPKGNNQYSYDQDFQRRTIHAQPFALEHGIVADWRAPAAEKA